MVNSPFARKQDRQQPYPPQQPEPAAPPAAVATQPAVAWPDDEVRQTVIRTNQEAWARHDSNWRGHLAAASKARADLAEMNQQFDELRQRIDKANEYIAREDHYAGQEEKTRDGYAAALDILGAPVPFNVFDAPAAGQNAPEPCQGCGQPMRWTPERGFVHDIDGRLEPAGELCEHRQDTGNVEAVAS